MAFDVSFFLVVFLIPRFCFKLFHYKFVQTSIVNLLHVYLRSTAVLLNNTILHDNMQTCLDNVIVYIMI